MVEVHQEEKERAELMGQMFICRYLSCNLHLCIRKCAMQCMIFGLSLNWLLLKIWCNVSNWIVVSVSLLQTVWQ